MGIDHMNNISNNNKNTLCSYIILTSATCSSVLMYFGALWLLSAPGHMDVMISDLYVLRPVMEYRILCHLYAALVVT
jgi:hypothetical protein